MAIDHVHDTQFVYRHLLNSMARPGKIASLQALEGKNDYQIPCYDATFFLLLTLLDAEVTFHILGDVNEYVTQKVAEYTLARQTTIDQADFIIVLQGTGEAVICKAMTECKKGTLIDPHTSATWLVETSFAPHIKGQVILKGPGIKNEQWLTTSFSAAVWQARERAIQEYPLGIDLVLTDDKLQLSTVPRTTKINWVEVN